ncbi:MAG: hypothetical protein QM648_08130 [Solirubrobacterales bacterium]
MTRSVRRSFTFFVVALALALSASSASAVTFDPVGNAGATNADPVVITYHDPQGSITGANCILDYDKPSAIGVSCGSGSADLGSLPEGSHSLLVNGVVLVQGSCVAWIPPDNTVCVGWSMNSNPVSGQVSFAVDRTAPDVAITGGPEEGSSSTATSATFDFTLSDGSASCALDGAGVACSTSAELSGLGVGSHQFVVTATDQAGNVGTATRNFTVTSSPADSSPSNSDNPASTPKIISAPKSVKPGKKITLTVSCPDGCTITVSVKGSSIKTIKSKIVVKPGQSTATFRFSSSQSKTIKKMLGKKKSATAKFTLGGASKSVKIKP